MPRLLVPAALARYLRHRSRTDSDPRTAGRYKEMAAAVRRVYPRLPASRFGGKQLKRVRHFLLTERTCRWTGLPLARGYVNNLIGAAVRCWVWLLSEGLVGAACVAQLQAVQPLGFGQGGREPARVLPPPPGWDRVLHHLTATVRAMIIVQVCGAMRPQDVCRMRRKDLSTRRGERVEFPGTGRYVEATKVGGVPVWVYVPPAHKGSHRGKPRAVPLGPRAQAVLAPLMAGLGPDDQVFDLETHIRQTGKPNQYAGHKRFTPGVYGSYIARAIERANHPLAEAGVPTAHLIPHWSPHQLRHLQATAVGDELDREHARALLGHSGRGDTIDDYMEQQFGKAARAAAACG